MAYFKSHTFDIKSQFRVTFEGEPAIDGGGPRREFFSILIQSLTSPECPIRLFEGRPGHLLPLHNIDALLGGMYKFAGNMIAASILQEGPGFPLLSPALYRYLSSQSLEEVFEKATAEDISDCVISDAVAKVHGIACITSH